MTDVYRDGHVHVRAEPCDRCLYSADRLVSGARARDITADTRAEDGGNFVCHRGALYGEPEAICAAWWDRFADEDWIMRLAKAEGIIKRV
jgi:hypothetical protein